MAGSGELAAAGLALYLPLSVWVSTCYRAQPNSNYLLKLFSFQFSNPAKCEIALGWQQRRCQTANVHS